MVAGKKKKKLRIHYHVTRESTVATRDIDCKKNSHQGMLINATIQDLIMSPKKL